MKQHWSLADVLDLEFFLSCDQELMDRGRDSDLARRDREIYLQVKNSCQHKVSSADRAWLLRQWLSKRRLAFLDDADAGAVLPGGLFQELARISAWGVFLLALVVGWGLALSFLSYSGTTPVNVSFFFALFVGGQLFFLLVLLVSFPLRLIGRKSLPITYALLRKGVVQLAVKLGRLPSATDTHRWLGDLSGRLQRQQRSYGLLFALPFFLLMQMGGIGFNLGVLAATLLKVIGTDIAFGWQSTLQLSSEAVHHLVQIIAVPWSWALPAHLGYPDLVQIRGSQMVFKDGIYHLATENLVSWWPFLCLAVAVYGLLPRVCLLLAGWFANRSLLARLEFNTAAQQHLWHRMLTPRLSTESTVETPPVQKEEESEPSCRERLEPEVSGQVLALVPDEIFDSCAGEELAHLVRARLGLRIERCLRINQEGAGGQHIPPELKQEFLPAMNSVLLLQEAWQPPIEEFFFFLRKLREELGPKIVFSLVFIGKPTAETVFSAVRDQDYATWQQKIVSQGDPYLQCVRLVVS